MGLLDCGKRRVAVVALAVCLAVALPGVPVWAEGPEEPGGPLGAEAAGDGGGPVVPDEETPEDGGPVAEAGGAPEGDGPGEDGAALAEGEGAAALGRMPTAAPLSAPAATTIVLGSVTDKDYGDWTADSGVIELTGAGPYVLTGDTSDYRVVVSHGGQVAVTLRDASITTSDNGSHAFDIEAGAEVALWLEGSSKLAVPMALVGCALHVPEGAAVEIDGGSGGRLEADSRGAANSEGRSAGIGGAWNSNGGEQSGEITIAGGRVTAKASNGAGIGGGGGSSSHNGGNGGGIYITGGVVVASSSRGAGIGGGYGGNDGGAGGEVHISGGAEVTASSGDGAGIGGGYGGNDGGAGGDVHISGGAEVTASSGDGAGIGGGRGWGGDGGAGGEVHISGGAEVTASSTNGAGIGGGRGWNFGGVGGAVVIDDGAVVKAKSTDGADIGGGSSTNGSSVGQGSLAVGGGARLELEAMGTGVARDAGHLAIGECVIEDANGNGHIGGDLAGSYRWLTVGGGSINPGTALEPYWLAETDGGLAHQIVRADTLVTVTAAGGADFGRWYTGGFVLDETEQVTSTVTFAMPAENAWIATTDLDYVPPVGGSRGRSRSGGGGSSQRSGAPVALAVTADTLRWDGGTAGLTFSVAASPIALMGVAVDGAPLEPGQYRAGTETASVTLPGAYLEGLPAGEHTLTLQLWHGVGTVRFTV